MRFSLRFALIVGVFGALAIAGATTPANSSTDRAGLRPDATSASCRPGSKPAIIAGNFKCLRVGQHCQSRYQAAYRKYGFRCISGRLRKAGKVAPPPAPAPAPPPAAPTPAAVDGHYKGVTSQNETFEFDIVNGGLGFKGLKTGQINEGCTPPGHLYGGNINWPDYNLTVSLSGDFTLDTDLVGGYVGQWPSTGHLTIRGHMSGQVGSGSLETTTAFKNLATGVSYSCGSGLVSWTVTRTG